MTLPKLIKTYQLRGHYLVKLGRPHLEANSNNLGVIQNFKGVQSAGFKSHLRKRMRKPSSLTIALCLPFVAIFAACSSPAPAPSQSADQVVTTSAPSPEPNEETSPTPEPVAPTSGDTRVSKVDSMEQIYVGEGEFIMGTEDDDSKQTPTGIGGVAWPEGPEHPVWVHSFWIDKYEVTNAQYTICVNGGACKPPLMLDAPQALVAAEPFIGRDYYTDPDYANYPVVYVDFYAARDYCAWAGRRLPTEAEWEKAARGTDGRRYTWGNDPVADDKANFCDRNCPKDVANTLYDDGYMVTAPVGSYPAGASVFGAMDMAGNVWEWVADWYSETYYHNSPLFNPLGPDSGQGRVVRGGSWFDAAYLIRTSVRNRFNTTQVDNNFGFRCAKSAP